MPSTKRREYILFCDESDRHGKYFSNFYGGVMVPGSQIDRINRRLNALKADLHIRGEVKWVKVGQAYLDKYIQLIHEFFDEVRAGHLRVRIMFRQNASQPVGLTPEQQHEEYFLLYYQFIKHAYGLRYLPEPVRLRLYFDRFPDTREKAEQFKGYLRGLTQMRGWQQIEIRREDITEVNSHNHVLLQCLDVVLGAMSFRLNNKHKRKPPGAHRRGNRTIAKEKLYKAILHEIRTIHPHFNIGVSTKATWEDRWSDPYLHWKFVPSQMIWRSDLTKRARVHRKRE